MRRIEKGSERVARASFVGSERGEDDGCHGEPAERARRAPADVWSLDEGVDEQQHPGGDEDGTGEVEVALPAACALAGDQCERADACEEGDGHVEVEDPAPAGPLGEDAAEDDAGGAGEARDGGPGAERDVAVARVREGGRQDRERGRGHHRGADSLGEPGGDEHAVVVGGAGDERGGREQDQAADQDSATADEVGRATAEQEEAAVGEHVAADDPLQALLREAQLVLDRRQSDVDDRDVEEVEELDEQEQRECRGAATGPQEGPFLLTSSRWSSVTLCLRFVCRALPRRRGKWLMDANRRGS